MRFSPEFEKRMEKYGEIYESIPRFSGNQIEAETGAREGEKEALQSQIQYLENYMTERRSSVASRASERGFPYDQSSRYGRQ